MWFCPRAQHSLVYTYTWPRPLTDALLGRGHSVHLLLGRGPTYTNTDNTDDSDTEQGVFISLLPCYYSYSYQFQFQFQYLIASVALHTSTIQMCWCPFLLLGGLHLAMQATIYRLTTQLFRSARISYWWAPNSFGALSVIQSVQFIDSSIIQHS